MSNSTTEAAVGTATGQAPPLPAWTAVAMVTLGTFAMVTTEFLPIGLLTAIGRDFGVSDGQAGLMVTIPGLVAALAAPTVTVLAGSTNRRTLLVLLAALVALSNVIVAMSQTFAVALAGRVLLGISVGGFWTFAAAVGRRLVPEKDGGRATALILAGISIGTVVGVPLGTALGALAGWRVAFGTVAALALLTVGGQMYFLPSLEGHRPVRVRDLGAVLVVPRAAVGFAASALVACGHFAAYTYLEPYLTQVAAFSPVHLSAALAAYGLAGVFGNFLGERATAQDVQRAFVGVALLLAASIVIAALLGTNGYAMFLAVVLWGTAFGAVPVCVQIWTYQAAPAQFETGSAVMVSVFQIALAVGAFGGGGLVDHLGLRHAFGAGAALCGLGAALVFFAPHKE